MADEIDLQIQAIQNELAALRAQPEPSLLGGLKQFGFDVGAGAATAGAGLLDVLSLPLTAAARGLGADPETTRYFALSKELQKAKEAIAPTLDVAPDTRTQELVSFLTPSPLSKAKLLSQAGTGLASYLGMKGAEAVVPESQYAGLVGALAAPGAASKTASIAKGIANKVAPTVGIIAGSEEALKAAAQAEVLARAGKEGAAKLKLAQSISALGEGTGGVPLTAAEIAQSPQLAKYQQVIAQSEQGGDILKQAKDLRQTELAAALSKFGVEPQQGDFALALRDIAEQSAAAKVAKETQLLSGLSVEDLATKPTKAEAGSLLQKSLLTRAEDAYQPVRDIWGQVNKKSKMDIAPQINEAVNTFNEFDDLTKSRMSDIARATINRADDILNKKDGLITIKDYQGLRASANAALKNATKGTDRAEIALMNDLKSNLDNIDESAILKGTSGEEVAKLTNAIAATKDYYKTYGRGVVSEIIKQKGGELSLKASQVIDRAVKYPENVSDIVGKFGKQSDEAVALRSELLDRLSKQQNPTKYLGENKDLYKQAFDADYGSLVEFAQSKGRTAPLAEFAKVIDTAIPNKIFADTAQANKFANTFKNTELFQYARSKFINTRLTKSGDPLENLAKNKKIAAVYFPEDLGDLEAVLKDMQLAKTPLQLATSATKGQSWTSQMRTTLGAVMSARGLVGAMKKGTLTGGMIGLGAGPVGSAAGAASGYIFSRIGEAREAQLNELAARFLADPRLLNFAKAPPTEENVKSFFDVAQNMGYFGGKAAQQEALKQPSMPQANAEVPSDIDAAIEAARKELEALRGASKK
jgi:hypothetical protein